MEPWAKEAIDLAEVIKLILSLHGTPQDGFHQRGWNGEAT